MSSTGAQTDAAAPPTPAAVIDAASSTPRLLKGEAVGARWGASAGARSYVRTHLALAELAAVDAARTAPVTEAGRAAALRESAGTARDTAWRPRASIMTPGVGCHGVRRCGGEGAMLCH